MHCREGGRDMEDRETEDRETKGRSRPTFGDTVGVLGGVGAEGRIFPTIE